MIEIQNILEIENHLDGIKAAIFDLDDTLYSEKEYVKSGFNAVANEFPQITNMSEKLWKVFENKGKAIDEILKSENIYSEENKNKCLDIYRNHKPDIQLYDGVREMLERIKIRGIKLGIITDGRPEGQNAKIEALKIRDLFDQIIITDGLGSVEFRKPNKAAFIKMYELMKVPYNQMLYVGDNIQKDFIAPNTLGMKSILYKNTIGLYVVNVCIEKKN